jgi:hypothetical protein
MDLIYEPTFKSKGWFDPTLDVSGWFDDSLSTTVSSGPTLLVEENCDDTPGTALTTGNSVFEILNGSGTSNYVSTPAPIGGTTCLAFDGTGSGNQRTAKDTSVLPGTQNGGSAARLIYGRLYIRANATPSAITRFFVFEQSVAAGGADIGCVRINATGAFAILDGTTSRGASSHAISTTEWTRVEVELDQTANTITGRLWWGADVNSSSTSATNYETWSGALNNNNDAEVWGVGNYATNTASILYIDEVAVSLEGWIGPYSAPPSGETSQFQFGIPIA